LNQPVGLAVDSANNLYIADSKNFCIRKVDTNGNISTVAGSATNQGYSGDGGPATQAKMNTPYGVAVDSAGNIYIADSGNNRIRKVSNGIITTIAGTGSAGFSGDGGPATKAQLRTHTAFRWTQSATCSYPIMATTASA
jgi:internalin A